jgi:hypothetical protein
MTMQVFVPSEAHAISKQSEPAIVPSNMLHATSRLSRNLLEGLIAMTHASVILSAHHNLSFLSIYGDSLMLSSLES